MTDLALVNVQCLTLPYIPVVAPSPNSARNALEHIPAGLVNQHQKPYQHHVIKMDGSDLMSPHHLALFSLSTCTKSSFRHLV